MFFGRTLTPQQSLGLFLLVARRIKGMRSFRFSLGTVFLGLVVLSGLAACRQKLVEADPTLGSFVFFAAIALPLCLMAVGLGVIKLFASD